MCVTITNTLKIQLHFLIVSTFILLSFGYDSHFPVILTSHIFGVLPVELIPPLICAVPNKKIPEAYVNLQAFVADLYAAGVIDAKPGYAVMMMCNAFEERRSEAAWERDCHVMAAAQWIIWHGQSVPVQADPVPA